jgi:Phage protein (N4 Gp49/phage Sf6 gene 66) family
MSDNRVTPEQIKALLDSAETQEHVFWSKELFVSYKLSSGFTVTGRGACIDPANFNLEIGRKVAREDAENQLWQLEGYRKQIELHEAGQI